MVSCPRLRFTDTIIIGADQDHGQLSTFSLKLQYPKFVPTMMESLKAQVGVSNSISSEELFLFKGTLPLFSGARLSTVCSLP